MEKLAAAYHEIGHFTRAIRAHEDAAISAVIQRSNQGWGDNTQVIKTLLSDDDLYSVELAGFLAEGMGVAKRGKDAPGLVCHPQLAADVLRCIFVVAT